ncbi:MAG: hypothetical protein AB1796_03895, partial [Bacillota bacterium]
MRTYRTNLRKLFLLLLVIVIFAVSIVFPFSSSLGAEEGRTVTDALNEAVSYYRGHKTGLDHWEELVALKAAEVNLHDGSWQLPAWGSSATEY